MNRRPMWAIIREAQAVEDILSLEHQLEANEDVTEWTSHFHGGFNLCILGLDSI